MSPTRDLPITQKSIGKATQLQNDPMSGASLIAGGTVIEGHLAC
jgi:hypothetical protein